MSPPVALVTGSSRGIGRAIAIELSRAGFCLALCARSRAALSGTVSALGPDATVLLLEMELTDEVSVRAAFVAAQERFGVVHLLVNCAVYQSEGDAARVENIGLQDYRRALEGSVVSQMLLAQLLLSQQQPGPKMVVQLVSSSSHITPSKAVDKGGWGFQYASTKSAIAALVPILGAELRDRRPEVLLFNLEPGLVVTDRMIANGTADGLRKFGDDPPEVSGKVVGFLANELLSPGQDKQRSEIIRKFRGKTVFAPKLCADLGLIPGYAHKELVPKENLKKSML